MDFIIVPAAWIFELVEIFFLKWTSITSHVSMHIFTFVSSTYKAIFSFQPPFSVYSCLLFLSLPFHILDSGFCVKAYQQSNNEKCFINVCISDGIPPPEDISPEQLTDILSSETPSNYKIPISITELRLTPDKSGNQAVVCDVAINPQLFAKVEALVIFRDFLITIVFEALDRKYNMQINRDTWIILKNRKCMGSLVTHRVENRDVKKVYESYQNPTKEHKTLLNEMKSDVTAVTVGGNKLITEIDSSTSKHLGKGKGATKTTISTVTVSTSSSTDKTRKPEYRLFKTTPNDAALAETVIEFFLPEVMKPEEICLDVNRERIVLECQRAGYLFDSFFPFEVDASSARVEFNDLNHVSFENGIDWNSCISI